MGIEHVSPAAELLSVGREGSEEASLFDLTDENELCNIATSVWGWGGVKANDRAEGHGARRRRAHSLNAERKSVSRYKTRH